MTKAFLKRSLRRLVLFLPCLAAAAACQRPDYTYSDDVPVKGTGASSGITTASMAGTPVTSAGSPPTNPCAFNRSVGSKPILADQVVRNPPPPLREVYAELTDSEADAIERGGSLLPPASQQGASSALSNLLAQLQFQVTEARRPLVQELMKRFKSTRSTWPNPWALRLVEHGATEHMNPLRIVFKPEALIVRIVDSSPTVVDVENMPVTPEQALATPERIAAVYYVTSAANAPAGANSISPQCETDKRELALGNEAMVETVSLRSKEILARLNADIDALNAFFEIARPCNAFNTSMTQTFHSYAVCTTWTFFETTEFDAYVWSLSNPVEQYKPTGQNIANLVMALEDDRFDVSPFVGTPMPQGGEGGGSGQGGADFGGAGAGAADAGGVGGT